MAIPKIQPGALNAIREGIVPPAKKASIRNMARGIKRPYVKGGGVANA